MTENRLKDSASPYLRSAAHQPIDWYEWGSEAFAQASKADKPILLDIGAVWCHWCHVIDRESYEESRNRQDHQRTFCSREGGSRRAARRGFPLSSGDQRDHSARWLAVNRISDARRQAFLWRNLFSSGGPDEPAGVSPRPAGGC